MYGFTRIKTINCMYMHYNIALLFFIVRDVFTIRRIVIISTLINFVIIKLTLFAILYELYL